MDEPVTRKTDCKSNGYIPNSILFDFKKVFCDTDSNLPHTMPQESNFTKSVKNLGINQDSLIVIYDNNGIYCAPRVWWMFKSMGHHNIYVLNGGLPNWLANNMPKVANLNAPTQSGSFQAKYNTNYFLKPEKIYQQLTKIILLDARNEGRFNGTQPEPRNGLRSGHIPTSINLPFQRCIKGTTLKSTTVLKAIFSEYIGNSHCYLVFSCGSGITACILALAATEAGYTNMAVYDGSWSEWALGPIYRLSCKKLKALNHMVKSLLTK